jgi:hypothetical protein
VSKDKRKDQQIWILRSSIGAMVHTKAKVLVTALSAILLLLLGLTLAHIFWHVYGYWCVANNPSAAVAAQSNVSMELPKPPKYADARVIT